MKYFAVTTYLYLFICPLGFGQKNTPIPAESHFLYPSWLQPVFNHHISYNDSTLIFARQNTTPPYRLLSISTIDMRTGSFKDIKNIEKGLKLTPYAFQDLTMKMTIGEKAQTLKGKQYFNVYDLYNEKLLQSIRLNNSVGGKAAFNHPNAVFNKTFSIIMHYKNSNVLFSTDKGTILCKDAFSGDIISENFLDDNIEKFNFYFSLKGDSYFVIFEKLFNKKENSIKDNSTKNSDMILGFNEFSNEENEKKVSYVFDEKLYNFFENKKSRKLLSVVSSIDDNIRVLIYEKNNLVIFKRKNNHTFEFARMFDLSDKCTFAISPFITAYVGYINTGGINNCAAISQDNNYIVIPNASGDESSVSIIDLNTGEVLGIINDYYTGSLKPGDVQNVFAISKKQKEKLSEVYNGVVDFSKVEFSVNGSYLLGFNGAYDFQKLISRLKK